MSEDGCKYEFIYLLEIVVTGLKQSIKMTNQACTYQESQTTGKITISPASQNKYING